jgi:hypothetical protein
MYNTITVKQNGGNNMNNEFWKILDFIRGDIPLSLKSIVSIMLSIKSAKLESGGDDAKAITLIQKNNLGLTYRISDETVFVKASCFDCGREASYTYYEGSKDEAIKVGDEGYFPLCARCLLKRRGREGMKKVLRLEHLKKNES